MYPRRARLATQHGLPTRCRCTRRCAVMPTASTQPLIRCARRGMPAQHCFCCSWGGQNSRAAAWTGLGWSQPSTPCSPHVSPLHPRIAATTAVPPMRRIGPVSTVGVLINVGLAPCFSALCSSRVRRSHSSSSSRHRHGGVRAASAGQPGHVGVAEMAHGGSGGGPPAALLCRHACAMPLERACGCAVSVGRRADAPRLVGGTAWPQLITY